MGVCVGGDCDYTNKSRVSNKGTIQASIEARTHTAVDGVVVLLSVLSIVNHQLNNISTLTTTILDPKNVGSGINFIKFMELCYFSTPCMNVLNLNL